MRRCAASRRRIPESKRDPDEHNDPLGVLGQFVRKESNGRTTEGVVHTFGLAWRLRQTQYRQEAPSEYPARYGIVYEDGNCESVQVSAVKGMLLPAAKAVRKV